MITSNMEDYNYSYLKASVGFNLDALYAGATPEIAPTIVANAMHPANRYHEKCGLKNPQPNSVNNFPA